MQALPTNPALASVVTAFRQFFATPKPANTFRAEAVASLTAEYTSALQQDPQRQVRTPGFGNPEMPIAAIIEDHLGGVGTDAKWHELMRIVAGAAQGHDMHLRAAAWVKQVVGAVAEYQAEDLVAEWADDAEAA